MVIATTKNVGDIRATSEARIGLPFQNALATAIFVEAQVGNHAMGCDIVPPSSWCSSFSTNCKTSQHELWCVLHVGRRVDQSYECHPESIWWEFFLGLALKCASGGHNWMYLSSCEFLVWIDSV